MNTGEGDLNHRFCSVSSGDHDPSEKYSKDSNTKGTMADQIKNQLKDHTEKGDARERERRAKTHDFAVDNTCKMSLVADQYFFRSEGGGDVLSTANFMIRILEDVNAIYVTTSFDNLGSSKVQLSVAKITIFEGSGTRTP